MAGIIKIPKHIDDRGEIHIADRDFPFEVKRVLWIYDLKDGRGEKAQRECEQVYVMLQGWMFVEVYDGTWKAYLLERPNEGLYLPKMTWRTIKTPSSDAILLVLCSEHYDPNDKIADFDEYLKAVEG